MRFGNWIAAGVAALISLAGIYFGEKSLYQKTGSFTSSFDYLEKPLILDTKKPNKTPASFLLEHVPFTPQAPHANWDATHEEACEEAAALMVAHYVQGDRTENLNPDKAEEELQKIIAWEKEHFGFFEDTTTEQTARILKEFYGLKNVAVRYDITVNDIKREVGAGRLVIVPAAGRKLGNPFYKQPGPVYHNLVITGYTTSHIITNDAGTKRGLGFRYSSEVLGSAIHDWAGSPENIETGRRAMIVAGSS